jgi:hypothetical protein
VAFPFKPKYSFEPGKFFCYAGDWFFVLDLASGNIKKCFPFLPIYNIYENPDENIPFNAVGKACPRQYCSCFQLLPLGALLPDDKTERDIPTLLSLVERREAHSHNDAMRSFLSGRLYDSNRRYSKRRMRELDGSTSNRYVSRSERKAHTRFLCKGFNVTITATGEKNANAEGSECMIERILLDNKAVDPATVFQGKWLNKDGCLSWNDYTDGLESQITAIIPESKFSAVVFQKNRWRGIVKIDINGIIHILDCYNNSDDGTLLFFL